MCSGNAVKYMLIGEMYRKCANLICSNKVSHISLPSTCYSILLTAEYVPLKSKQIRFFITFLL